MVRTRSSVLLDALSKKYQVPNLYEKYVEASPDNISKLVLFKKPENLWEKFQKETRKKTDEIMSLDKFAIKLFPASIIDDYQINPKYNKNPNWNIDIKHFLDLETYFDASKYDQIYILYRENMCDVLCSYWHAYNKNFFLTDNKNIASRFVPKGDINFNIYDRVYTIKSNILYKKYLQNIENYFDKKNIKYTKLEYNEVPKYLEDNFKNIELSTIDTNYDYKNLVDNYETLQKEIEFLEAEVDRDFSKIIF
jgi:hypothetical protein